MKDRSLFIEKIKNHLFYGGISKKEYYQVQKPIAEANKRALEYWSVLVCGFWLYCLLMSLNAPDYALCRPAYTAALSVCVFTYFCTRFVVKRFPKTLAFFKYVFRLALLRGGIGIAVCQWNMRSLTLFAVAIISPSIFVDSTLSSLVVHCSALIMYIVLGSGTIDPEIYSWGLGNYILFSVFGILIGNAINKERFERYVYAESEKKLAEVQMRYAYYNQMTGLKNRRAYEEKLLQLSKDAPSEYCVVMADINRLKEANDTSGHDADDELITGAAECLFDAFEGVDTIYRIGGDEFCILLVGSIEEARRRLDRLDGLISNWHGSCIGGVSVSTGVASSGDHGDIDSVIAEADKKMYECKRDYYLKNGIERRKY